MQVKIKFLVKASRSLLAASEQDACPVGHTYNALLKNKFTYLGCSGIFIYK
mgnify:CR=1 FL=1